MSSQENSGNAQYLYYTDQPDWPQLNQLASINSSTINAVPKTICCVAICDLLSARGEQRRLHRAFFPKAI
ncbi:MAG: hypothetical protein R3204_09400, partial [Oceanospirillum sp.]|nr:hypothetical protein [Oceanospirillum sp.]